MQPIVYFTDNAVQKLLSLFEESQISEPVIRIEAKKEGDSVTHDLYDIDITEVSEYSDENPSGDIVFRLAEKILVCIASQMVPLIRGIVVDYKEELESPTFTFFRETVYKNDFSE